MTAVVLTCRQLAPDNLLPKYLLIENSDKRWQQDLRGAITARGYEIALRTRMNTIYRSANAG